jgi:RNA polymerase sigma factor (sigma-70 family)
MRERRIRPQPRSRRDGSAKRIQVPEDPSTERMPWSQLRIVSEEPDGAVAAGPISFDEFFAAQSQTLYRRMRLVTRSHHEAEEVVQDAFLSLYERWERMADILDPVGYLYRTAFNVWKKRSRRAAQVVRNVLMSPHDTDAFEAADARTVVEAALDHLTPRQRAAIVLTELIGFSSEQAGEILGIRPVTARVLTSQARAALRALLEEQDG